MVEPRASQPVYETVLVVDDEPMVRMLVVETLEEHGYAVIEAEDSQTALSILDSVEPIHLLVTDVALPGQNGRQLADAAKKNHPGLKILFMTGYAHNVLENNGAAEVITKPFSLDGLVRKVRALLDVSAEPS